MSTPVRGSARVGAGGAARIVAAYAAIAVALTFPLVSDPAGLLAGGARTDAPNSVWSLWFVHDALTNGRLPLHTVLLDHPHGGRIAVADPLNALLGLPLVAAFGPVAAYALLVLGHLTFAGVAAHLLGRRLGGHGWVAGVGYQLAPIVLTHVHNGSSETVSAGWLPLAALALVDAAEHGGAWRVLRAGAALALCAAGGWYAGIGAFVFAASVLLCGWHRPAAQGRPRMRVLAAALLGAALVLPLAVFVKDVANAPDGLVDIKNADDLARIRRTLGAADPRTLAVPGDFRSPDFARDEANPNDRVHTAYLGFTLIGLALLTGGRRPGADAGAPRNRTPLVLTLAGGAALALGPVLVLDGFPLGVAGRALPLPYALLERLPGFDSLSLLYRLVTVSALMLALLADRAQPRWAWLVAAEVLLVSPARGLPEITPVPDLPAIRALGEAPEGAVVNLPVQAGRNFLFEQTVHRKPVCGSLNAGLNRAGLRVLHAARQLRAGTLDRDAFVAVAREEGVRYVVLHTNILMDETFVASTTGIRRAFTPMAEDARAVVYRLW